MFHFLFFACLSRSFPSSFFYTACSYTTFADFLSPALFHTFLPSLAQACTFLSRLPVSFLSRHSPGAFLFQIILSPFHTFARSFAARPSSSLPFSFLFFLFLSFPVCFSLFFSFPCFSICHLPLPPFGGLTLGCLLWRRSCRRPPWESGLLPSGGDLDSVPARALWRPVLSSSLVAYQVVPLGAWHATGYGGGARPAVLQTGGSGPISWGATRRESGGAPRKCRTSVRCAFASRLLARKGADWTAADCLRRRRSAAPPVGVGVEREAAGGSTDCLSLLMTPPPHAEPPSRGEGGQYPTAQAPGGS